MAIDAPSGLLKPSAPFIEPPADVRWLRWRSQLRMPPLAIAIPAGILATIVIGAIVGPFFLPDPNATALREANQGIGTAGHILGTDALGRDILSRALHGARISLFVGVVAVGVCMVIGGAFGVVAGYRGGFTDTVVMRIMDTILAFPALVLALTISTYLGPSIRNVIIAIVVSRIPAYARLARATTLSLREREFVWGSKLLGSRDAVVMVRHIVPNLISPMLAYGLLAVGIAIIVEASLSFLGLGVRPPQASWGIMISEGRAELERAPHIALVPGAMLFATILSLNLLADAVRSRVGQQGSIQ
jgi:peptide/nickel transport system permease protein